ncbi:Daunorubicin/doxorubicin resistance ATP-binding protein DrrA [compost metagenome]
MREFIRKLAGEGLSVFVSSHLLSEIQLMCDRVAIISHGEVIAVGEVKELIQKNVSTVVWHAAPRETASRVIAEFSGVQLAEPGDGVLAELEGTGAEQGIRTEMNTADIPALSRALQEHQVSLYEVSIKHPTLEELFLRLTEGERIE